MIKVGRGAIAAVCLATAGLAAAAPAALAEQPRGVISDSDQVSGKVKVKAIDKATRHLTVTTETGETTSMKVSPEARNFEQLKVGDTIKVTYLVEVGVVVSPPNGVLPKDTDTVVAARAAKGELPAGIVANHIVVNGNILAIDRAKHTVKVANAKGGEVHMITVKSADGQALLAKAKVGDKISIYATESLIVSTSPA